MISFSAEETIGRPVDQVFEFAANVMRHPQWMGISEARMLSGRPTEVGATALETMKFGPRNLSITFEVTEIDINRRIVWRSVGKGPLWVEVSMGFESLGSSAARVTYAGKMRFSGIWRLVEPLLAAEVRQGEAAELRRLKSVMESQPSGAAAPA